MQPSELCDCGQPLHYTDPAAEANVRRLVAQLGPLVRVQSPYGIYLVPRHYVALHGLRAKDLPFLALVYGWKRV